MTTDVHSILGELYEIDPGLREHEAHLIPLIQTLQKRNPGRAPDERFVAELRSRLQTKAAELSDTSLSTPFSMNKFLYLFGGAFAALVIAVPVTYMVVSPSAPGAMNKAAEGAADGDMFAYQVTALGDNAFGGIVGSTQVTVTPANNPARPQSGGGGAESVSISAVSSGIDPATRDAKMMAPDSMIYPPQELTQYNYVFDGEMPALDEQKVDVLKRLTGGTSVPLGTLSSFGFGAVDLASFNGARVENFTLLQDTQNGYYINVNLNDGSIGINQNWQRWPHPEQDCRDDACFARYTVKLSDVPADDQLIAIADAFVKEHGIDTSKFGPAVVGKSWKRDYETTVSAGGMGYVPQSLGVVYPLLVDGETVFDDSGQPTGLSVNVDIRNKKVSDVWGITSQKYQSSGYDAVTAEKDIRDYLAAVDNYSALEGMPSATKIKKVTVKLGTPQRGFVKTYNYDQTKGTSSELIVPALIFPIESSDPKDAQVYRQSIIVPLAKQLLDASKQNWGGGAPMPMVK